MRLAGANVKTEHAGVESWSGKELNRAPGQNAHMEEIMGNSGTIVAVVFFAAGALFSQPIWRQAAAGTLGSYQIAPQANTGNAWVVNTATGRLRLCQPPAQDGAAPECGPWAQ